MSRRASADRGLSSLALVVTVLVVAANLRPAITVVGPLIEQIGAETGMNPAVLGLLGSIPVLSFAVISPLVAAAAGRWGTERTIFAALVLLASGTVVRSLLPALDGPAEAGLFAGTVLLSVGIGVGNVLVPAVVKRDFPDRVAQMTGLYTAVLVGSAAAASALAVPLAAQFNWELALGGAAVLALLAAALWTARLRSRAPDDGGPEITKDSAQQRAGAERPASSSMWASPLAWQVTFYFGLQSAIFYTMLTWFPAVQTSVGVSEAAAGAWLAAYQAVGILASLMVGQLMQRRADHRVISCGIGVTMALGLLGMVVLPGLMPLWALLSGFASGGALLAALTLISMRARTPQQAGRLSGMAQGVGYLLASVGPVLAGALYQLVGSWTYVLIVAAGVALAQAGIGLLAGRDRHTH